MSKKNKQFKTASPSPHAQTSDGLAGEYKIIKGDLVKVLVINLLFLAGVLALYFTNQKTHYLEAWFSKFLHF